MPSYDFRHLIRPALRTILWFPFVVGTLPVGACRDSVESTTGTEVRLEAAVAALPGLDPVSSLVELPDGRLFVTQGGAQLASVMDLETGAVDTIGRKGEGPGEYRFPADAFIRDGKLWVMDGVQQRLVSWDMNGVPSDVVTYPVVMASNSEVDTMGNIYYEQPTTSGFVVVGQEIDTLRSQDSTYIYRFTPPATKRDTVARIFEAGWETIPIGNSGIARMRKDYVVQDVWGVLPDGTVWIARGHEHRVDRRAPDGTWSIGTPRPWTPIPTTDADRKPLPVFGGMVRADTGYRPMAETKGAFGEAVAAPDGEVWTHLHQNADATTERYAIFPVSGPSTRTVVLPKDEVVFAISREWVYTRATDEDGLQRISRWKRPGS